jgi:hypothetical protein
MTFDPKQLIDGYLDETLSPDEHAELNRWLKANPQNAREMVEATLLHDRLRSELLVVSAMGGGQAQLSYAVQDSPSMRSRRRFQPLTATVSVVVVAMLVIAVLWRGLGESSASAAVIELNRLIAANAQPTDRTYQITVEEAASPARRDGRAESPERGRPPKPPMEGARLHVRGGQQFVLVRTTTEGLPFVTGSNGQTSWAVRTDGPVRLSSDLTRFSHDLPGHEHSMPLNSIHDGLERLREAYDVQLLPVEIVDDEAAADAEPSRLLVAVKKPGFRGPKRVEITYSIRSGFIRQMRFVEMPYGPERLTLRLTLVEERELGPNFFDHESHHDAARDVIDE